MGGRGREGGKKGVREGDVRREGTRIFGWKTDKQEAKAASSFFHLFCHPLK